MNLKKYQKPDIILFILLITVLLSKHGLAQKFNMEQTLSEGAQRTTIAFDGLAFITGSLGADSFFPPGKVADFWGFQYLRDNDPTEMGHNTDFLTKASLNMMHILTSKQINELITLAKSQVNSINDYALNRFVLMKAFRRLLEQDMPEGATNLDREAVKNYSAELYMLDGKISYERAKIMGGILKELTDKQKEYLDAMVGKGMLEWPDVEEPEILKGITHDEKVAVMTYSGDLFSWYAGSVDADVYFCPERQGTYFGSFYLKDAPAVGNPNYSIGTNITADYGNYFLNTLDTDVADSIKKLVDIQKPYLLAIVDTREEVCKLLRNFIIGDVPDSNAVIDLMKNYGELDGEIVYYFACYFTKAFQTLDSSQLTQLNTYRHELIGDLNPLGAYLYATPIEMPEIINTDFLFSSVTKVENSGNEPTDFTLEQNYPNPFNPQTTISYQLMNTAYIKLTIYDLLGKEITILVDETQQSGRHSVLFNADNLPSGLYYYKLESGNHLNMKKMILIK